MSGFIKEILLPERIKSYYLFTKIVVGIEINKTKIIATKTRITGTTSTLETIIEEKISEVPSSAKATADTLQDTSVDALENTSVNAIANKSEGKQELDIAVAKVD